MGWLIALAYVAGMVFTARKVAWWLLNDDVFDADDMADQTMLRLMGFLVGLFWPLAALVALITGRLPKTDQQIRDLLTIRDADIAVRDRRIAELERDLGIGSEASHG